jgi:hypothetical protein
MLRALACASQTDLTRSTVSIYDALDTEQSLGWTTRLCIFARTLGTMWQSSGRDVSYACVESEHALTLVQ